MRGRERRKTIPHLGKGAAAGSCLGEVAPEHALHGRADEGGLAEADKLEALLGDERDVLAVGHGSCSLLLLLGGGGWVKCVCFRFGVKTLQMAHLAARRNEVKPRLATNNLEDSVGCGLRLRHNGTEPAANPRTRNLGGWKGVFPWIAHVPKRLTKESGIWRKKWVLRPVATEPINTPKSH